MNYIFDLLAHYGLGLGFVLVAIENIGIPFPIEFVYLYVQHRIILGDYNFWVMMLYFTAGHLTGSSLGYLIGFYSNSFLSRHLQRLKGLRRVRDKIENWYLKYGSITSFITRLVGYVRPWSSIVAGFGKEPFSKFIFWTAIGTIIFNYIVLKFAGLILYLWTTYYFSKYFIVGGFIFFFILVWLFWPWVSKKIKF